MSFSTIDGYAIVADLKVGGNGTTNGMPELVVGTDADHFNSARMQWDSNLSDGLDSGWVNVQMTVKASGGAGSVVLNVNHGEKVITFSGPELSSVWGVIVRAGDTGANTTTSFANVFAKFYTNESDTAPDETDWVSDFESSTVNTSNPDAEAIVYAAPDEGTFQKVTIFCDMKMQSAEIPDPNDLFGQLFIYGDAA